MMFLFGILMPRKCRDLTITVDCACALVALPGRFVGGLVGAKAGIEAPNDDWPSDPSGQCGLWAIRLDGKHPQNRSQDTTHEKIDSAVKHRRATREHLPQPNTRSFEVTLERKDPASNTPEGDNRETTHPRVQQGLDLFIADNCDLACSNEVDVPG
jgi:hypothetical protein